MATRIDVYLVEKEFTTSRQKAQALIAGGFVLIDGTEARKSSQLVEESQIVTLTEQLRYVGRGGYKLERALEAFGLSVNGLICADVGASTGGFTDCMLQNGAARVYAIDSGHDQLSLQLIDHPRVVNLEGCNIRDLPAGIIPPIDFAAADLSFISLTLVFVPIRRLLTENAAAVFLIKPQFEAGRGQVGKGVVQNPQIHLEILTKVLASAREAGFLPFGLEYSPILGGDGNIEFLLYAKPKMSQPAPLLDLAAVVASAHEYKKQLLKRDIKSNK